MRLTFKIFLKLQQQYHSFVFVWFLLSFLLPFDCPLPSQNDDDDEREQLSLHYYYYFFIFLDAGVVPVLA